MSEEYFRYLTSISWKGRIYRNFMVYPKIKRYCEGEVLDIGCGMGQFLEYYKSGVGVDINKSCVKYCVARGLDVRLMSKDELPFSDSSFDTLIMDKVMEHIIDPQPLLIECRRVLKPKAALIILVPGAKGYTRDPDHKVFYNFAKLNSILSSNGLVPQVRHQLPL